MSSLIGTGPSFPLNVSSSGGLSSTTDIDRINQSLFILLSTRKGDRLMLPEFGSDIHLYRFDPLDQVLVERLRHTITNDIGKWEPRISLVDMEFSLDETNINNSTLYVSLTYNIINTDVTGNYVYPYKLEPYSESYNT